jgi:phage gpG-like protein
MIFNITLVGDRELAEAFRRLPAVVIDFIAKAMKRQTLALQRHIVEDYLSGQVLHVRSGALRRSIFETVDTSGPVVTGQVFSSGDVKYAAIHEFGGTIHHPGGTAYFIDKDGGLAVFVSNQNPLAATLPRTAPHEIPIPARPYMRPALEDRRQAIIDDLSQSFIDAAHAVNAG